MRDSYTCPSCKGVKTQRLVEAPAVHMPADGKFRGSGKAEMDQRIGADAEAKYDVYTKEQAKRNEVRRASGQYAVGRKADGTYVPVPEQKLDSRTKAYEKFAYARKTGIKVEH